MSRSSDWVGEKTHSAKASRPSSGAKLPAVGVSSPRRAIPVWYLAKHPCKVCNGKCCTGHCKF